MKRHVFARQRPQRGVASLIVVLVLFLVVSLVAAYTNRNLIFEQRTGANQYRSNQAMEAAQAGLEWAQAMLNHGRITASCNTSTVSTDTTFRERYLSIATDGLITPRSIASPLASLADQLTPSCVYNGSGWDCDCPSNTAPTLTPASSGSLPAFRVRFLPGGKQTGNSFPPAAQGLVRVEVVGCTRLDNACLSFAGQGAAIEGRAIATELLALTGGLPSPPAAPLTAGGAVALTGGAATVLVNGDSVVGGATVQAVGAVSTTGLQLVSLPGTPGLASVLENDVALPTTADRMFAGFFNMWPATYRRQPATVVLNATTDPANCTASGCNAAAVRAALLFNPGRVVWIDGELVVDSTGNVGSAAAPAMIVATGNLRFTSAATIYGLVYVRNADWASAGTGGVVQGGVIAEGSVHHGGSPSLVYDAAVLKQLRLATGSFVKVSGGWKDFCSTGTGAIATSLSPVNPGFHC